MNNTIRRDQFNSIAYWERRAREIERRRDFQMRTLAFCLVGFGLAVLAACIIVIATNYAKMADAQAFMDAARADRIAFCGGNR